MNIYLLEKQEYDDSDFGFGKEGNEIVFNKLTESLVTCDCNEAFVLRTGLEPVQALLLKGF